MPTFSDGSRAVLKDTEWKTFFVNLSRRIDQGNKLLQLAYITKGFSDIIDHFRTERSPIGRWTKSQRAIKEGGATLQDTGNLRRNFLKTNIDRKGDKSILVFNSAPYSGVHDRGSQKKNIPQRQFMWFSDRALDVMGQIVLNGLVK